MATDEKLIEILFLPGFSTADNVSILAGRGVGMDVVKNEIVSLGGQIDVTTKKGLGTKFQVMLPVSLATTQAVLIEAGNQMWAVPAEMVDQIKSLKWAELESVIKAGSLTVQNVVYPFHYLPHIAGEENKEPEKKAYNSLILLSSGGRSVAILVDRLIGTSEIVVKNIGRQMSRIAGISGATVLGDGRIGVIINPVYLANRKGSFKRAKKVLIEEAKNVSSQRLVMIVDDSLTIRKATSKLLLREGYTPLTAKDGEDALEQLQEHHPDVIISDVEMPRMDGFELAKNIRANAKYRDIPIVMITSRTADKHKQHALSLGVDVYLGKPYKHDELLEHLAHFCEKGRGV